MRPSGAAFAVSCRAVPRSVLAGSRRFADDGCCELKWVCRPWIVAAQCGFYGTSFQCRYFWNGDKRMLKIAIFALALFAAILIGGGFYILQSACSLPQRIDSGTNKNSETSKPSENDTTAKTQQSKPSATFDLRVTEPYKIEGKYYAQETNGEKDKWSRNFLCDTRLGEFAVAARSASQRAKYKWDIGQTSLR
jgi:hypothetical protein